MRSLLLPRRALRATLLYCACILCGLACRGMQPGNVTDRYCEAQCRRLAGAVCTAHECRRGCSMTLDRTIEHESEVVMRCMAQRHLRCDDAAWAECAVRVGPYVDDDGDGEAPRAAEHKESQ